MGKEGVNPPASLQELTERADWLQNQWRDLNGNPLPLDQHPAMQEILDELGRLLNPETNADKTA